MLVCKVQFFQVYYCPFLLVCSVQSNGSISPVLISLQSQKENGFVHDVREKGRKSSQKCQCWYIFSAIGL